jgi:hypothetical protein
MRMAFQRRKPGGDSLPVAVMTGPTVSGKSRPTPGMSRRSRPNEIAAKRPSAVDRPDAVGVEFYRIYTQWVKEQAEISLNKCNITITDKLAEIETRMKVQPLVFPKGAFSGDVMLRKVRVELRTWDRRRQTPESRWTRRSSPGQRSSKTGRP